MNKNTIATRCEIMIDPPDDNDLKQDKPSLFRRVVKLLFFSGFLGTLVVIGVMTWYGWPSMARYGKLTLLMDRLVAGRYHQVLTSAFTLKKGTDLDALRLLDRLKELSYTRSRTKECTAGQFFVDGGELYLSLHTSATGPGKKVQMHLQDSVVNAIINLDTGFEIPDVTLEPLVLTSFLNKIWEIRVPVAYEHIPDDLVNAVLATEDRNFFTHPGVDITGILRAAWVNFRAGQIIQGGSTITQQLVKTLLNRQERTIEKKYTEALLALALEWRYSKVEILTIYLNNVYLGTANPFEIRGIAAASNYIFGKNLSELNLKECAMLGGLIRSPNSASPLRNSRKAASRLKTVLKQMAEQGDSLAETTYINSHLRRIRHRGLLHQQVWFFDRLQWELKEKRILPARFSDGQLLIHTTLDPWLQAIAYRNMQEELTRIEKKKKLAENALQGAIITLNPYTGGVLALVGGRDYLKSPFNRAVSAKRQIGSLIKPFIYLTGLGGTEVHGVMTQATLVRDSPLAIRRGRSIWRPHNYDRRFKGEITARQALVESRNIPAVKVGRTVGLESVVQLIRQMGINENPPKVPALFLGALESSPMRMAGAFSSIANGGSKVVPHCITNVYRDKTLLLSAPQPRPILTPGACYVVTDMLSEVMRSGTASYSRKLGFSQIAAGKTGTTNKLRDSWFAGFTPSLTTVCWVGRDNNKPSKLTGSTGALPVWVATMQKFLGKGHPEQFHVPDSVWFADIDPATGTFATWESKKRVNMAFVKGMSPRQYSSLAEPFRDIVAEQTNIVHIKAKARKKILYRQDAYAKATEKKRKTGRLTQKRKRQQSKGKQGQKNWLMSRLHNATDWLRKKNL